MSVEAVTTVGNIGRYLGSPAFPLGGIYDSLVSGLAWIEASPIYYGVEVNWEVSGTRVKATSVNKQWQEQVGTDPSGDPVYATRNYTETTTVTEEYAATITRTLTRAPFPARIPTTTVAAGGEVNGRQVFTFGDALNRVFAPAETCYMLLAPSVGARSVVAYTESGTDEWGDPVYVPVYDTNAVCIDPTRAALYVVIPGLLEEAEVIGTRTTVYTVTGTPPPGHQLPEDKEVDITLAAGISLVTMQALWGELEDEEGLRTGPAKLSFSAALAPETFEVDVSGWDEADWRDQRNTYASPSMEWPVDPPAAWDSSSVATQFSVVIL